MGVVNQFKRMREVRARSCRSLQLIPLMYHDESSSNRNYKFVNNNKQLQAIKCCFPYNLLTLCTLMYFGGEINI